MSASETVWMIRAGEGGYLIDEFKKGYVAVGFNEMGDLAGIKSKEELKKLYLESYPQANTGAVGNSVAVIHKFCNVVKVGDAVISYDPSERKYLIGSILSDYRYDPGAVSAYPQVREVKWTHDVSRDALETGTRNSLGSTLTLFEISPEAWKDIQSVIAGKPEVVGLNFEIPEKTDFEATRRNTIAEAHEQLKDKLVGLDPYDMQDLVAALLRAMGFKTRVSPRGPDRGVDVFASPDGLGLQEPRIKAEVKHRKNTVIRAPDIRSFLGGLRPGDRALYVSTGGFSKDAKYEAERATIPLTLLDLDELATLVSTHYEKFDNAGRSLVPLTRIYWPSE